MRLHVAALVLALIVVVSGCTGREVRTDDKNGLVVNRFESDLSRMEEGEQFTLFLEIENVGGTTAENVKAAIYGANWARPEPKVIPRLSPPDILTTPAIPGDFYQVEWTLPAPDLEEGVEQDFRIVSRVSYTYSSNPVSNIPALSKEEYRRRTLKGGDLSGAISTTNTPGPVSVSVSGSSPIIVRKDLYEGEQNQFVMRATFQNVGYGIPITGGEDGKITGHIKIKGTGATLGNCLGKDINSREGDFVVILRSGSDVTKGCTINIDKGAWNALPEDVITLELSLDYEYYIDSELTVTSIGRISGSRIGGTPTSTSGGGGGEYTTPFKLGKCTDVCKAQYVNRVAGYTASSEASARCRKKGSAGAYNYPGHTTADNGCTAAAKEKGGTGNWGCFCDPKGGTGEVESHDDVWCMNKAVEAGRDKHYLYLCVDTSTDKTTGKNSCQLGTGITVGSDSLWCDKAKGLKCCIPASAGGGTGTAGTDYDDYCMEKALSSGDETAEFLANDYFCVNNEICMEGSGNAIGNVACGSGTDTGMICCIQDLTKVKSPYTAKTIDDYWCHVQAKGAVKAGYNNYQCLAKADCSANTLGSLQAGRARCLGDKTCCIKKSIAVLSAGGTSYDVLITGGTAETAIDFLSADKIKLNVPSSGSASLSIGATALDVTVSGASPTITPVPSGYRATVPSGAIEVKIDATKTGATATTTECCASIVLPPPGSATTTTTTTTVPAGSITAQQTNACGTINYVITPKEPKVGDKIQFTVSVNYPECDINLINLLLNGIEQAAKSCGLMKTCTKALEYNPGSAGTKGFAINVYSFDATGNEIESQKIFNIVVS